MGASTSAPVDEASPLKDPKKEEGGGGRISAATKSANATLQKQAAEVVQRLGIVVASVLLFMACSCSMLIVNKLVIAKSKLPFTICEIQMAFSVIAMRHVEHIDFSVFAL